MIAESESHKIMDSKTMWNINVESLSSCQLYNTTRPELSTATQLHDETNNFTGLMLLVLHQQQHLAYKTLTPAIWHS